jgi:hypothetical protein
VHVVLVGLDEDEVGDDLLAALPGGSTPVVRIPQFYGLAGRDLGLSFTYDYDVIDSSRRFERRFFDYLQRTGVPGEPTAFQQDYNDQASNVLDVTGPVLTVDAPRTERWLQRAAQQWLGVDERSYTVFLVNWYGDPEFQFHVYRKTDSTDPDTGYNFGTERDSRAIVAWGGTHGRSWFFDISAGPEAWSNSWNVDDADVDGDGLDDRRIPPIWEYDDAGYRDPAKLGGDLGDVVRFVAINLLFTSSPLYDPLVTAPEPFGAKTVPITMFQDDPDADGTDWIDPAESVRQWRDLEPHHRWRATLTEVDPIDPDAEQSFRTFTEVDVQPGCWEPFGTTFAALYCFAEESAGRYYPDRPRDYEAGVFAFNTTDDNLGVQFGLLGFADDNWTDGTQSYVFAFDSPFLRDVGYGFTTTTTHEVGHHVGLSHPHDGYDSEYDLDYGPAGDFQFTWLGDQSDTVMSYLDLATDGGFGRFDSDNMSRFQFAGYANWASSLVERLASARPGAFGGTGAVRAQLRLAERAFDRWDYVTAAGHARRAYELARILADRAGVGERVRPATTRLAPQIIDFPKEDPIRFPDE